MWEYAGGTVRSYSPTFPNTASGCWAHLVISKSPTTITWYWNGLQIKSFPNPEPMTTGRALLTIGMDGRDNNNFITGSVGPIEMYNMALAGTVPVHRTAGDSPGLAALVVVSPHPLSRVGDSPCSRSLFYLPNPLPHIPPPALLACAGDQVAEVYSKHASRFSSSICNGPPPPPAKPPSPPPPPAEPPCEPLSACPALPCLYVPVASGESGSFSPPTACAAPPMPPSPPPPPPRWACACARLCLPVAAPAQLHGRLERRVKCELPPSPCCCV